MLENPHTGERHSFANLESLLTFLRVRSQIKFDKETHPQRFDRYPKSKVKNGQALNDKLENKNLDRSK
ncbi:MAG: hypothetical protein GY803_02315 [Chloroflexi bacterium]|nr:hypothetical protein [Chloroflexota bacterium]